jgi:hypothetical protein
MRYYIKSGFGYWDTTHYPIGGNFQRADKDIELGCVENLKGNQYGYKGCHVKGIMENGNTVAVGLDCLIEK